MGGSFLTSSAFIWNVWSCLCSNPSCRNSELNPHWGVQGLWMSYFLWGGKPRSILENVFDFQGHVYIQNWNAEKLRLFLSTITSSHVDEMTSYSKQQLSNKSHQNWRVYLILSFPGFHPVLRSFQSEACFNDSSSPGQKGSHFADGI